jgi:hypothetical protein
MVAVLHRFTVEKAIVPVLVVASVTSSALAWPIAAHFDFSK